MPFISKSLHAWNYCRHCSCSSQGSSNEFSLQLQFLLGLRTRIQLQELFSLAIVNLRQLLSRQKVGYGLVAYGLAKFQGLKFPVNSLVCLVRSRNPLTFQALKFQNSGPEFCRICPPPFHTPHFACLITATGNNCLWALKIGNRPNTASESTVPNAELSEFFDPHQVPAGGERPQRVPLGLVFVCQSELTEFCQNSPSLLQNSESSLFSETALSKQYSARFLKK